MKIKLIVLFLFPIFCFGQQFWNTSCSAATFLSQANYTSTSIVSAQPGCTGSGPMKIYYYFRAETAPSPSSPVNTIHYNSSVATTYKIYGYFNSKEDGCNLSSSWGSYTVASSSSSATTQDATHNIVAQKVYILEITIPSCSCTITVSLGTTGKAYMSNKWIADGCTECVSDFRPKKGVYVVSGWVKDKTAADPGTAITYTKPTINVSSTGMTTVVLTPTGSIIDGWQRVEGEVTTVTDDDFNITLNCASGGDCYFDDIRVFPYDGTMFTYVYDPITLRLLAELDERNYAKLYEYDEDGKLIRVKQETERGVMTVEETRENNSKRP